MASGSCFRFIPCIALLIAACSEGPEEVPVSQNQGRDRDASVGDDDASEDCVTGDLDCECYPNQTCNDSLRCVREHCIDPLARDDDAGPAPDDDLSSPGDDDALDDAGPSGDDDVPSPDDDDVAPDDDVVDGDDDVANGDDAGTEDDEVSDDDVASDDDVSSTCGNGVLEGRETCDDGNPTAGDGCSSVCQVEATFWDVGTGSMRGWDCSLPGRICTLSVCGDGTLQPGEPCDDGNNNDLGDGCSPGCRLEPDCSAADGSCVSRCGDGLIVAGDGEQCDDGNDRSGDGCSETCTVEDGFVCSTVEDRQGTMVSLPIVYRDFYGVGWEGRGGPPEYNPSGHVDFENEQFSRNTPKAIVTSAASVMFGDISAPTRGLVNATLGSGQNGVMALKPVFANTGTPAQITGAATFHQWYADTAGVNVTVVDNLLLNAASAAGTFVFDTGEFYPLDGRGLTAAGAPAPGPEPMRPVDWLGQGCGQRQPDGQWTDLTMGMPIESRAMHNYSFTSEFAPPAGRGKPFMCFAPNDTRGSNCLKCRGLEVADRLKCRVVCAGDYTNGPYSRCE